jgi:hypothetical protein
MDDFSGLDLTVKLVVGCDQETLSHNAVAVTVFHHVKAIGPFLFGREGCRRGAYFEGDVAVSGQRHQANQETNLYQILFERQDLGIRLFRQTQDGPVVKLDLGTAILSRVDPVGRLKGHVDTGSIPVYLTGMLKTDMPLNQGQSGNPAVTGRIRSHRIDAGKSDQCEDGRDSPAHMITSFPGHFGFSLAFLMS